MSERPCPECEGRGTQGPRFPQDGERAEDFKCPRCDGSGFINPDPAGNPGPPNGAAFPDDPNEELNG